MIRAGVYTLKEGKPLGARLFGNPIIDYTARGHGIQPCQTRVLLVARSRDMPTERVIEIPWALSQLPQSGVILDVGSCDATYLQTIPQTDRTLHCLDPRDCRADLPPGT